MNPDQTSTRSSLIWVHIIAISAAYEHKQARGVDDKGCGWWENVNSFRVI